MQTLADRNQLERQIDFHQHRCSSTEQLEDYLEQEVCPEYASDPNLSNHPAINRDTLGVIMGFLSIHDILQLSKVNRRFRNIVTNPSFDPFWRNRIQRDFAPNLNVVGLGMTVCSTPKVLWYHILEYWLRRLDVTTSNRAFHTYFRARHHFLNNGAFLPHGGFTKIKKLGIPSNVHEADLMSYKALVPKDSYKLFFDLSKRKRFSPRDVINLLQDHFLNRN